MINTKLIIVDGMPGSGKSTTAKLIGDRLNDISIPNRFFHELDDEHPLRIYDRQFTSFTIKEEAEWFVSRVKQLFSQFVTEQLESDEVIIIESYVFQNTIGFAYNMGMQTEIILELTNSIQEILSPLEPALIYYYQINVEQNWRWICEIRGPEFALNRCGLYTDEDFIKTGEFWTKNQEFILGIVLNWMIPKLIINNKDYHWHEYKERIFEFLNI